MLNNNQNIMTYLERFNNKIIPSIINSYYCNECFWNESQQYLIICFLKEFQSNFEKNNILPLNQLEVIDYPKEEISIVDIEQTDTSSNFEIPDFEGIAIKKNQSNLLFSKSGDGKSSLSIAIGLSINFKKCLYILVDSSSNDEYSRFKCLEYKSDIVTLKNIQNLKEDILKKRNMSSYLLIKHLSEFDKDNYKKFNHLDIITNNIFNKMGIKNKWNKNDFISSVIDTLITDVINRGFDFICIDSLNGLFGDSRSLNRNVLTPILQKVSENNITLLCLHHTNSKNQMSGSEDIKAVFDNVWHLFEDNQNPSENDNERILFIKGEKIKFGPRETNKIKVTYNGISIPKYKVLEKVNYNTDINSSKKEISIREIIINILNNHTKNTISKKKLISLIYRYPAPDEKSVINVLTTLKKNGIIKMADGRTWENIIILKE